MSDVNAIANTHFQSLITDSGLSLKQVARLYGVGVSQMHHWKASGVPERFQERTERLQALCVAAYPETSPEGRLRALLSSSKGQSPYHALMDEVPESQQLHFPLSVAFRLGIGE